MRGIVREVAIKERKEGQEEWEDEGMIERGRRRDEKIAV